MKTALRVLLLLAALGFGALAVIVWQGLRSLDQPLAVSSAVRFRILPGASFSHVAADLHARGYVANPRA